MDSIKYIIYGTNHCSYCVQACETLESLDIERVFLDMQEDPEGLFEAKSFYNWHTIPIILRNDDNTGNIKFIGGYTDLIKELETRCGHVIDGD